MRLRAPLSLHSPIGDDRTRPQRNYPDANFGFANFDEEPRASAALHRHGPECRRGTGHPARREDGAAPDNPRDVDYRGRPDSNPTAQFPDKYRERREL